MSSVRLASPNALKKLKNQLLRQRKETKSVITVCAGTGCLACGCAAVSEAFREALKENGLEEKVEIRTTGCHGFCERGPLVVMRPEGIFYQRVKPADAKPIVEKTIQQGELIEKLLYRDPQTKQLVTCEKDIPFYNKQERLIFGMNGHMDPTSIEDYIALGGYQALAKVLASMQPEEVIEEVKKSGLRGRGGGGFLTGRKWATCRRAEGEPKYIICNADEGDPGAFMDRSLLEGNPHAVVEGMLIGAYAIGSYDGYVYVRNEYPLAVKNLNLALDAARDHGLLGSDILGSDFSFDIHVSRGGGAFVCGESTALMASLEGKVGEPRAKYIHTVESGLWGKPSTLNNVETWANVPTIIEKGADWYRKIGTENSTGTKVFALTGKVNNTGLVEVPMGMSLREIVFDIGGGILGDRTFKAVQTGGPSGGCLPTSALDLSVDFDTLTEAGSMMGSGGLIVMDDRTCMVDLAKYFIHFLLEESCGKCVPCREGLRQLHQMLEKVAGGEGGVQILDKIERLCSIMEQGALCALGRSAPNPVMSTIRYFREEYLTHLEAHRCPAGVCKALITYSVIDENCTGCEVCRRACPVEAITGEKNEIHKIHTELCTRCGICLAVCKFDAIRVE
ncbi:MAG: NADH-ubiquinone oxidoreductase-F iron-sulfur binding region domain-containing protein [bacterium]